MFKPRQPDIPAEAYGPKKGKGPVTAPEGIDPRNQTKRDLPDHLKKRIAVRRALKQK